MILIGADFGGPELESSSFFRLISAVATAAVHVRSDWTVGTSPGVNVVFYVPGSLMTHETVMLEAVRFSRKRKLALVTVPVPKSVVDSDDPIDFVTDSLHKANLLASEVFAKKGNEPFDFATAEAIVDQIGETLERERKP